MKIIKFSVYAEDTASVIFISSVVPKIATYLNSSFDLIHDTECSTQIHGNSKDRVEKYFIGATQMLVSRLNIDLCFVGRDADSDSNDDTFDVLKTKFEERILDNAVQDYIVLFFPVRAIEYWLYHIKVKSEGLEEEHIEALGKDELKIRVYNRKKNSEKRNNPIVEGLSNNIDIDYLRPKSSSFEAFFQAFKTFIDNRN